MSSLLYKLALVIRSSAGKGLYQSSVRNLSALLSSGNVDCKVGEVCISAGHSRVALPPSSQKALAMSWAAAASNSPAQDRMHAVSDADAPPPGSLHVPEWMRETLSKQLQALVDKLPKGPPVVLVDVTMGHAGGSLLPIVAPAASASGSVLRIITCSDFLTALETHEQQGTDGQDSDGSTDTKSQLLVPSRSQLFVSEHERVILFSMPPWLDYSSSHLVTEGFQKSTCGVYSARLMQDAVSALQPDAMLLVHPASLFTNKALWSKAASTDELYTENNKRGAATDADRNTLSAVAACYRLEAPCIFPASAIAPAVQADMGLVAALYTRPGSISWDSILATPMHVLPDTGTRRRALVLGRMQAFACIWSGWREKYDEAVKNNTTGSTAAVIASLDGENVPDMPTGIGMVPFLSLNELMHKCEVSDLSSAQRLSQLYNTFIPSLPCPVPLSAVHIASYMYCIKQHFGGTGIFGDMLIMKEESLQEEDWFKVACMVHMILHDPHIRQLQACQRPSDSKQQQRGALWRALQTADIEYALQALSELHQDDSLPAAAAGLPDLYGDALRWLRGEAAGPSEQVVQATGQWFKDYFAHLKEDVLERV